MQEYDSVYWYIIHLVLSVLFPLDNEVIHSLGNKAFSSAVTQDSEIFYGMRYFKYFQPSMIDMVQTLRKISFLVDIIFIIFIFRDYTYVFHTVQYDKYTENIIPLYKHVQFW